NEWNEYVNRKKYVCFLAKRFAVKEAASKALGTGIRNGVSFNQIELYNNIYGKPKLRFSKHAYKTFKKLKCNQSHVTVTDQRKYTC
ncbi:MAG: holo-ACP synthase, partial [Buchnera aphidicola]|nr:holo-ACP synthase [Buchnera aphidicola]MDE5286040.1 holo-ACP synthase [Buchnera aphidicola]